MDRGWCSVVLMSRRSTPTPEQIDGLGLMIKKRATLRGTFCQRSTRSPEAHHLQLCCWSSTILQTFKVHRLVRRAVVRNRSSAGFKAERRYADICASDCAFISAVKREPLKYFSEFASWPNERERKREKERRPFRLRQSGAPEPPHHANSSQALMISS